jgi:ABC-type uncharacterized transport system auxiliary subunit
MLHVLRRGATFVAGVLLIPGVVFALAGCSDSAEPATTASASAPEPTVSTTTPATSSDSASTIALAIDLLGGSA